MITTLILDIDGVLRHWDDEALEAASMAIGLGRGVLFSVAFDEELMAQSMTGVITAEEWEAEICRRAALRSGLDPAAIADLWNDGRWARLDDDVLELVDAVRAQGHVVALFSNSTTRLERDMEALGVAGRVDTIVSSARLGLAKPDPHAFRAAAERVGVDPAACVFVDDRPDNVDGARAAGMRAQRFAGVDPLRALLVESGLLDP